MTTYSATSEDKVGIMMTQFLVMCVCHKLVLCGWSSGISLVLQMESQNWVLFYYHKTSNISPTLLGNEIVDNSDVVGASPVGAAPSTSSFST